VDEPLARRGIYRPEVEDWNRIAKVDALPVFGHPSRSTLSHQRWEEGLAGMPEERLYEEDVRLPNPLPATPQRGMQLPSYRPMTPAGGFGPPTPQHRQSTPRGSLLSMPQSPMMPQSIEPPREGEIGVRLERPLEGRTKVGLHVKPTVSSVLKVTSVSDGLLRNWNLANPGSEVKVGYSIMAVNGIRGDIGLMLEQIRMARTLILYVKPVAKGAQQ